VLFGTTAIIGSWITPRYPQNGFESVKAG
jgi:hypothetical protein